VVKRKRSLSRNATRDVDRFVKGQPKLMVAFAHSSDGSGGETKANELAFKYGHREVDGKWLRD
jgi:hypothetical protein